MDKAQTLYSKSKAAKESRKEVDNFAMWSFVLSILPFLAWFLFMIPVAGVLLFLFYVPILFLSIGFGVFSFPRINRHSHRTGKGFAILGILISALFLVLFFFAGFLLLSL